MRKFPSIEVHPSNCLILAKLRNSGGSKPLHAGRAERCSSKHACTTASTISTEWTSLELTTGWHYNIPGKLQHSVYNIHSESRLSLSFFSWYLFNDILQTLFNKMEWCIDTNDVPLEIRKKKVYFLLIQVKYLFCYTFFKMIKQWKVKLKWKKLDVPKLMFQTRASISCLHNLKAPALSRWMSAHVCRCVCVCVYVQVCVCADAAVMPWPVSTRYIYIYISSVFFVTETKTWN